MFLPGAARLHLGPRRTSEQALQNSLPAPWFSAWDFLHEIFNIHTT